MKLLFEFLVLCVVAITVLTLTKMGVNPAPAVIFAVIWAIIILVMSERID